MIRSGTRLVALASVAALLGACSTASRLESTTPGTTLAIKGYGNTFLPREEVLSSKSVGQHEFLATTPDGKKMYGILPLRVNPGSLTTGILFSPAVMMIGGFRDSYAFYQIDTAQQVLRYRSKETEPWRSYTPAAAESARAQAAFDLQSKPPVLRSPIAGERELVEVSADGKPVTP